MQKVHPFAQYLVALSVTIAAYGGYAAWVAPRIEGAPPAIKSLAASSMELPVDDRAVTGLGRWLPPGSWELGTCKTLRAEDTSLYFQDYVTLDDGTVQIYPLTIVLGEDAGDPSKPPLIVRASEQALLKFDRPLMLGGESPGRLLSARMPGPVELLQADRSGVPERGLWFRTSNVQMTPQRIATIERVEFSQSGSRGSGRNLFIDLAHSAPPGAINAGFATVNGLARMELAFLEFLEIVELPDETAPETRPEVKANPLRSAKVVCRGPLVFDFRDQTARFRDEVIVKSTSGSGEVLTGDELQIVFDRVVEAGESPAPGPAAGGIPRLKPGRVIALGRPAKFDLPSQDASAAAEHLEYDLAMEQIRAIDTHSVIVRQGNHEFVSRRLEYKLRDDGALGPMKAEGPGRLVSAGDGESGEAKRGWQVTFQNQLTLQPEENASLVTIDGTARAQLESGEEIAGDRIQLWLSRSRSDAETGTGAGKWVYQPARMEVDGNATINRPGLEGLTRKLVALWRDLPAHAAREPKLERIQASLPVFERPLMVWHGKPADLRTATHRVARPSLVVPAAATISHGGAGVPLQDPRDESPSPERVLKFRSDSVTLTLQREGPSTTIEQIELEGSVAVEQVEPGTAGAAVPARSLLLTGNRLSLLPVGENLWNAHVSGDAVVDSPQLLLKGNDLHLDQAASRMWVAGPGTLQLKPAAGSARGSGTPPMQQASAALGDSGPSDSAPALEALQVSWAGGMIFDGNRVWFERDVRTEGEQAARDQGRTQFRSLSAGLTLTLDRTISFQQAQSGAGQPKVRELLLINRLGPDQQAFEAAAPETGTSSDAVVLERIETDSAGNKRARQVVVVPQLKVNPDTSDITAEGAGGIVSWQPGGSKGQPTLFAAGDAAKGGAAGAGRSSGLSCLHVNFDRGLKANMEKGTLDIDGNVRAVNGTVAGWDAQLDPNQTRPPEGATRMVCQHVRIVQWTPTGSETSMTELLATGDAMIQSSTFEARGTRLSYNQQSDMLVLEGDPRTEANLWYSSAPGARRDHLVAGKILYRPGDQWTQIEKVRSATINRSDR